MSDWTPPKEVVREQGMMFFNQNGRDAKYVVIYQGYPDGLDGVRCVIKGRGDKSIANFWSHNSETAYATALAYMEKDTQNDSI